MSSVDTRIHNGRCLIAYSDDEGEHAGWPEVAYESIRAINHLTLGGAMPAPLVYDVLGHLKGVGHMLPQALGQLGQGLARSLDEYDVYESDGGDPQQSVTNARAYLAEAAEKAAEGSRRSRPVSHVQPTEVSRLSAMTIRHTAVRSRAWHRGLLRLPGKQHDS